MYNTNGNTSFRDSINLLIDKCDAMITDEKLKSELSGSFVQWYATGQNKEILYKNIYIDQIAAKYRNYFTHTIDSLVLWCEIDFDINYLVNIIQKYNLTDEDLNRMNDLFLNKPEAIDDYDAITQQKEKEALLVVSIVNLMKDFMHSGIIPEYVLNSYRYCKWGFSPAENITSKKPSKIKKSNKEFFNTAISFYESILGQGYSKVTKTNGFWGRAMSLGKQKVNYNVFEVASNFALRARLTLSNCKVLFPFNPQYEAVFKQVINPYLVLDGIFSQPNSFVNYEMNVEDSLQKLLNFCFDGGMMGVRENMNYYQQSQRTNINVYDMQSLQEFVHAALLQANSWGVDGGPKNTIYGTIKNLLKNLK